MKKNTGYPIVSKTMAAQEKKWQAEDDARTLARASAIKADKTRVTAASGAAKKMLEEEKERVQWLSKVAKMK